MNTNRYPALRIVALIYKVIAIITAILTVIGACTAPFMGGSLFSQLAGGGMRGAGMIGGLISGLVVLLYGGFIALFLYAAGEVLVLLMDLEANTRTTVALLQQGEGR